MSTVPRDEVLRVPARPSRMAVPFTCPTCEGTGVRTVEGREERCITCRGARNIDPGYPPYAPGWWGSLRAGWKTFFGGG